MMREQNDSAVPVRRVSPWVWSAFAGAVVVSIYAHEVGHCAVAWAHGVGAVPTPAKEYILGPLTEGEQNQMALGGMVGSVVALLAAGYWLFRRPGAMRSAVLAGVMVLPGFYVLRFILAGRGHDGMEFQEAQAALGFSYAGHAMDWLFGGLFVLAAAFWFWRARPRPTMRLAGRLLVGAVAGLAVLVALQVGNNALFDRFFGP